MSYSLFIGLKEKPEGLGKVLSNLGFEDGIENRRGAKSWTNYKFYKEGESSCPVEVTYGEGLDDPEWWAGIDPLIKHEIEVERRGSSDFDFDKHEEVTDYLRDHYQGKVADPQTE